MFWSKNQKYRGMLETEKSGNKTSSGKISLNIRTLASPKVGQDQVSGRVSVLCWHAAPVAILWKPLAIRSKVKFGNKVQNRNRDKKWCNAWSMEGVTVDGHHPECRVTFGRGGPRKILLKSTYGYKNLRFHGILDYRHIGSWCRLHLRGT